MTAGANQRPIHSARRGRWTTTQLLPVLLLVGIAAFPPDALSWTDEVIEAAQAVANHTATPRQKAIAFQNNQAINEMALAGRIPPEVYHANQATFEKLNNRFIREAAVENGLSAKLQQKPADKPPQPGTDTDVLVERGKSGKPITAEQIRNTRESYNRKVEEFLTNNKVVEPGRNENWSRRTDTDFMPTPSHTTPKEFAKIAAETNRSGGTMYTDPRAAEVEAKLRRGGKVGVKEANSYVQEMQRLTKEKLNHANELDAQARELRRNSPQNEARARSLEAEAQLKRSQAGKYIERIDKVGGKLAEQHGVGTSKPQGPAAEAVSAVSHERGPKTAREAANVGTLGEHSLAKSTQGYAETLANVSKAKPELTKAAQEGIARTAADLSPSQKGGLIENVRRTHGDGVAEGVAKEMRTARGSSQSGTIPEGGQTAGTPKEPAPKAPEKSPSGQPTRTAEPASGRTAGKPEATAKAPADPTPGGKTSNVEPSGTKGGGRPASEPIVEPPGKGAKTPPEPTGKGGKTPGELTPTGKASSPEPASAGKATTPEPTGTKGGQPKSERIAEPSIKDGAPSAKTAAEPTGKPGGQIPDTPKGKGPVIDAPEAPKGRIADVPDAKPRVAGAPDAPKMGAMRKGVNIAGEAMNAAGILSDAEDFKEAAKKGDAEGMLRTGARGVAGLTPLGSAALGAKDTYDMVKERRGDKAEAEKAIAEANKRHEETYEIQSAIALRKAGMSRDEVKQIMAAKARGDEGPLSSKFKELGLTLPERAREEGPKADDTAWDRTKDVATGMATQVQKAGKFAKETAKDLTEIGTGLADKGTRDEVIDQVKENVSFENLRAGLEAHRTNKQADADRAAARDKLEDKLVEKGASRDEARNAADAWDQGDRGALDQLKDKLGLSGAKTGKSKPEAPETAPGGKDGDRLSDLRSSETRTDATDKEKRKDSPADPADGTKLAQNTNTADSYSRGRSSKSKEDADQARGDAGSTVTERIGADQARGEREKTRIDSQGQETNRAVAGAQREHAGAERGKQADRQNSIGNVIAEGAAGGLTSGVATGLDKLGSTVGAAAGDKASSRMGIKPKTLTQTQSPSGGADPGSTSGGSASREQTSPQTPAGGSASGGTQTATAGAGASASSGGQAPAASGAATATSATSGPKPTSSSGSQRTPASSSAPPTGKPCKNQRPGGPDWVCIKRVVCYSDRKQTVTDCAEWTNKRTGARTKPSAASSPTTTAAATPPPSATGTQSLWDCICRCNSSASSSVSVSYDLKPRNTSPSCAKPENGQCVNQGFGCWRHKFDSSSACAKRCYKSHNVAESARP